MGNLSAVVYDIEIARAIPSDREARIEGIKYCQGWEDYLGMGISVIGAYDYIDDRYRVFCRDNIQDFQELINARDLAVSYNGRRFDDRVLAAHGVTVPPGKVYDIIEKIWAAAGLPLEFNFMTHGGYSLGNACNRNFGTKKTGHGGDAPLNWQRAKIGNVIDYCLNDIALTKQLFDLIVKEGKIRNPKSYSTDDYLHIEPPVISGGETVDLLNGLES